MKCKHKWVDMEDGTLDKFCVRCRKFAMQAVVTLNAGQELNSGNSIRESMVNDVTARMGINIKPPRIEDVAREVNRIIIKEQSMLKRMGL